MSIPLPYGLSWDTWASRVYEDRVASGMAMPGPVEAWHAWGVHLLANNTDFGSNDAPIPDGYKHWPDWAARLVDLEQGQINQEVV